ncbi:MAG: type II/IV secretion system protein [Rhodocyclaceae bacterium]|nr:type II/IV secretion system protein [Rhodocyclaceae bacterium]
MAITLEQVRSAVDATTREGDWLSALNQNCADSDRRTLLADVAGITGYRPLTFADVQPLRPRFQDVPFPAMVSRRLLLIDLDPVGTALIVDHPFPSSTMFWLAQSDIVIHQVHLADPREFQLALEAIEKSFSAVAQSVQPGLSDSTPRGQDELTLLSIHAETSAAVRLVNSTIFDALRSEASDIHFESLAQGMRVKFRIDGALIEVAVHASQTLAEETIARIKVLAELDISERRVPQDGRFRIAAKGREIDIRTSVMPSIHGEDAVLRILDKKALFDHLQQLTLHSLGFDESTARTIRRLASEPYGMLLVTGPTGSGKTTTLYAALSEINRGEDKIITIEDPVEYQLSGVLQIPVNERKGLTFAVGLRSILRHDPDKILVGEIRDSETAQIAVQSALTGHMVFTSVHANGVFDVISRFMHMGVDPYHFVSALSGILAQRLVRQNCPQCSEDYLPAANLIDESGITDPASYAFRAGRGCPHCRHTGFRGRRAIAEVLRLTDELREMIVDRAPIREMRSVAQRQGTRFLREVALDMVKSGNTTLEEANRVTFVA